MAIDNLKKFLYAAPFLSVGEGIEFYHEGTYTSYTKVGEDDQWKMSSNAVAGYRAERTGSFKDVVLDDVTGFGYSRSKRVTFISNKGVK